MSKDLMVIGFLIGVLFANSLIGMFFSNPYNSAFGAMVALFGLVYIRERIMNGSFLK